MLNVAPTNATEVKAASLYQVNTGLVTVVLVATNAADEPAQIEASLAVTSLALATGVTVTIIALPFPAAFSHLLSPLTVT